MKKLNTFILSLTIMCITACESLTPAQRGFLGGLGGAIAIGTLGASVGAQGSAVRKIATIAGAGVGALTGQYLGSFNSNFHSEVFQSNKYQYSSPRKKTEHNTVNNPKVTSTKIIGAKFNCDCVENK